MQIVEFHVVAANNLSPAPSNSTHVFKQINVAKILPLSDAIDSADIYAILTKFVLIPKSAYTIS